MWRRLRNSPWFRRAAGRMLAAYITLVWKTSRVTVVPPETYDKIDSELPVIVTFWHGQQFLMSYVVKQHWRVLGLFSRHLDAEINAYAVEAHGLGTIRGSGDHGTEFLRKGALTATVQMIDALKNGHTLALTADVPKVARVAGRGIVALARHSGRAILPVAVSSTRRIVANSWDRTNFPLPFGRVYVVFGDPIRVAPGAKRSALESVRALVEQRLNDASARAEALVAPAARKAAHAG
jgi:lysophospholipid acyltransferase (LPLAT)-like uncharacterized protein